MQQSKNSIREGSPFPANPLQSGTMQMLMCPKQCYTRARTKRSYTTKNEKMVSIDSNVQTEVYFLTGLRQNLLHNITIKRTVVLLALIIDYVYAISTVMQLSSHHDGYTKQISSQCVFHDVNSHFESCSAIDYWDWTLSLHQCHTDT